MELHDTPPEMTKSQRATWLNSLLKKESDVRRIGDESKKNVNAAIKEAQRQQQQIIRENTITKSGGDD